MSLLTNFANTSFTAAKAVIGTKSLTIAGGSALSCVGGPIESSKDFEDGGFAPDIAMSLVCNSTSFKASYTNVASTYNGSLAVVGGVTYRVERIRAGDSHHTISLSHQQKA